MDYFVIVLRMLFSVTKLRNILKGSRITVCIISGMLFSVACLGTYSQVLGITVWVSLECCSLLPGLGSSFCHLDQTPYI